RLEKYFSPDTAAILAAGGLVGVSTGIEVPTASGLERMHKGVTLNEMVRACAAFKEAGILVHGYLIYGYWDQGEEEIIDAAEIVRQFFEQGLLDSAFWHKFTLGCHSRLCVEKAQGLHPGLQILYPENEPFALNNLFFKGEDKYDKYAEPLETLLSSWMKNKVTVTFLTPTVAPDLIQMILDEYAKDRNKRQKLPPEKIRYNAEMEINGKLIFLSSMPILQSDQKTLMWRWRLSDHRLKTKGLEVGGQKTKGLKEADKLINLLNSASDKGMDIMHFYDELVAILGKEAAVKAWKTLRSGGLVLSNVK
ncbi:MAG: radical SAM protein, partial [Treponema sp.]|nr:radical SAM protein [Treponema sp.]